MLKYLLIFDGIQTIPTQSSEEKHDQIGKHTIVDSYNLYLVLLSIVVTLVWINHMRGRHGINTTNRHFHLQRMLLKYIANKALKPVKITNVYHISNTITQTQTKLF